jgi:hypothetical protein
VNIPKNGWYGFQMSVPYDAFQSDLTYIIVNVSLGTLTSAGHEAWMFSTNNASNPTQNFHMEFTYSSAGFYAIPLTTYYSCSNLAGCTLYLFFNATCTDYTCISTVTTEVSIYGAEYTTVNGHVYYMPFFSPFTGVGAVGYPQLIQNYTSMSYPTSVQPQYFYVAPTVMAYSSPVTIFPSIPSRVLSFTTAGCPGNMPFTACTGYWTQKNFASVVHPFALDFQTYIQVNMTGVGVGQSEFTYQIGLTSGAVSMAASSLLVLLALLAYLF